MNHFYRSLVVITLSFLFLGCSTIYFGTMERLGYPKRDLLVSRVEDAKEAQTETKEQFVSALEKFTAVVEFDGGELEDKYKDLNGELEDSESQANNLRKRIDAIESVADALFDEWEDELDQYQNTRLRRSSEQKLRDTRNRYTPMIRAMRRAEGKMDPVLAALRDQVLFLKHNLNAQAIGSLREELSTVESDVDVLLREMESSIAEAERFIEAMDERKEA